MLPSIGSPLISLKLCFSRGPLLQRHYSPSLLIRPHPCPPQPPLPIIDSRLRLKGSQPSQLRCIPGSPPTAFSARCPQPPRRFLPLLTPVPSRQILGFSSVEKTGQPDWRNEVESVHLRYGSHFRYSSKKKVSLTSKQVIPCADSFHSASKWGIIPVTDGRGGKRKRIWVRTLQN